MTRQADGSIRYVPHQIDDDSGVGTQFSVGDLSGDGLPDIVIGNKKGGYVFIQQVKSVSKDEWEAAQPRRIDSQ